MRPCLDFVNTVGGRITGGSRGRVTRDYADRPIRENVPDYDSLLRWSRFASILEASEAERLRERAARSAPEARRVLRRAVRLREAIYRLGKALVEDWPPPAVVARRRRLEPEWILDTPRLDRMLWPVALSAAALFESDDVGLMKQCGGPDCGWLFLDTTRNHSRQWCQMADCGNLAKVRRFRQRHHQAKGR
jgi:predicted RNA-binding Zn ribbon-like protein